MDIKRQVKTIKDNWLISLIVLVLIFIAGSFNFNVSGMPIPLGAGIGEDYAIGGRTSTMLAPGIIDGGGFAPDIADRIITQSAYLATEVKRGRFHQADAQLKSIVKATDSFLLNENVTKNDSRFRQYYSGSYSIRVETSKYSAVISQLREIGEVKEFSESTDDITDGYTKLEIELEAERARLARYEALYRQAGSISDRLELSDRIYNQERTIKYYEDRLANLDETVDYSNASVQINEKHSDYAGIKFVSFGALVNNIVEGINNLLIVVFFLLPYAVVVGLIYYGMRWWRRNRLPKK